MDVLYWILLGSAGGFVYGWRRSRTSSDVNREIIDSAHHTEHRSLRSLELGYQRGHRLSGGVLFAVVGAIIGAGIWAALSLVVGALAGC